MPGFNTPNNPVNPIVRPILGKAPLFTQRQAILAYVETTVITSVTTIPVAESVWFGYVHPSGSWGTNDTDSGYL
jgi:hypothetical protein